MKILNDAVNAARKSVDTFLKLDPSKQVKLVAKVALIALGVGLLISMPALIVVAAATGAAFYYCAKERSAFDKLGDWVDSMAQKIKT